MVTGHVQERGSRGWNSLILDYGYDAQGNRRRKRIAIRRPDGKSVTKVQAEAKLRRILAQIETGAYVEPSGLTVRDFLHRWLDQAVAPRAALKTLESYRGTIERHGRQKEEKLRHGPDYRTEGLVFTDRDGGPVAVRTLGGQFARVAEEAGFPGFRIHDLRHTHATLLLSQGVHPKIVQERLGHSTITVTMYVYSHVLPGLQEAAATKLDDILGHQSGTKKPSRSN